MRRLLQILVVVCVGTSVGGVHAQAIAVAIPAERANEFSRALRVELGSEAPIHVASISQVDRVRTQERVRELARTEHAGRVVWLDFAAGDLLPPTLWSDTEPTSQPRSQTLSNAVDVLDARAFAVAVASLLDSPVPVAAPVVADPPRTETATPAPVAAEIEPPPAPRRRVLVPTDRAVWAVRLGGELGGSTLRGDMDILMAGSVGLAGYVAPRWRIDGDVYLMFGKEGLEAMRGAIGASYFFDHPATDHHWLLGGRVVGGVYTESFQPEGADGHGLLGAGAFLGHRDHLGPHFAIEERLGADLVGRFGEDQPFAIIASASLLLEYVF